MSDPDLDDEVISSPSPLLQRSSVMRQFLTPRLPALPVDAGQIAIADQNSVETLQNTFTNLQRELASSQADGNENIAIEVVSEDSNSSNASNSTNDEGIVEIENEEISALAVPADNQNETSNISIPNESGSIIVPPISESANFILESHGTTPEIIRVTVPVPTVQENESGRSFAADAAQESNQTEASASNQQLLPPLSDSPGDFRCAKRKRVDEPPQTNVASCKEECDDANTCPICFEDWTTSGSHRLVCLKCGHLFGQLCIEKWLKSNGKCPQCNAKAKRADLRVLYTKSIVALDTSERDRALEDLQKEKESRRRIEMEAAQARLQVQLVKDENTKLKAEIERLQFTIKSVRGGAPGLSSASSPSKMMAARIQGQYTLEKTIKIHEGGNCRVMAYCPTLATLVVSQPSPNPLFPGFGVKKISSIDMKTSQYLTLHSKAIRDICFNPSLGDGILLSVSLDKCVKMTSMNSNAQVQIYEAPSPVWSCVWNTDNTNAFYVGLVNGTVLEYDVRNTTESVQTINTGGNRSPVVALQYITRDPQSAFRPGGLLVGQLEKVTFYEKINDDYRPHILPLEGSLSHLCFEPKTRNLLASYKPTSKNPNCRHMMCEMTSVALDDTSTDRVISCNVVQTFHGGRTQTVLSKSLLHGHPADSNRLILCAGLEATNSMQIWDCGTEEVTQNIPAGGVVVDICSAVINQTNCLWALTDKHLRVHRWIV